MKTLSYPDRKQIIVVGYPRSGNTYLSRLLGQALNAPVTGAYSANPLATEGLDRDGPYVVRQLHLRPTTERIGEQAVASAWQFSLPNWYRERIVHIIRDPRDVAVSAHHYWQRESLYETIEAVAEGNHPLKAVGPWGDFVDDWFSLGNTPGEGGLVHIKYHGLVEYPIESLYGILSHLDLLDATDIERITDACKAQSFRSKRSQVEQDGDSRPYGKTIQLRHMRKGIAGDWRNHFDQSHIDLAFNAWGRSLLRYGFELDNSWTRENKDE